MCHVYIFYIIKPVLQNWFQDKEIESTSYLTAAIQGELRRHLWNTNVIWQNGYNWLSNPSPLQYSNTVTKYFSFEDNWLITHIGETTHESHSVSFWCDSITSRSHLYPSRLFYRHRGKFAKDPVSENLHINNIRWYNIEILSKTLHNKTTCIYHIFISYFTRIYKACFILDSCFCYSASDLVLHILQITIV